MSMAPSSSSSAESEPMMELNMTPLIDVMLVLIIMLITTLPVQNHSINLNMPTNSAAPKTEEPVVKTIDVDFDGTISWNGEVVTLPGLEVKLTEVAATPNQPEVHLRPNKLVAYKSVAAVMASAQRLGVTKIGMVGNEQFLSQ
ncbi:MAG: biopolymer transporter ExbD [Undibacterium sp.]|jgi:biopolymer transport protein ExbD|nr:biopolymer transporter ExbD [Undibacterium sp.]MDO8702099.1 biopolymer transporter ExbD [Undibacterium sp.]MDO9194048.1 biopolymer transporter ExbD [Undibacterium sp.]